MVHCEKGVFMLKMSLNEIRGCIQLYPENWTNIYTTNCYAYALGLDVNESSICRNAYHPGVMSKAFSPTILKETAFPYDLFIKGIEQDLKALNLLYKEVEPDYITELDEWKMAVFIEIYTKNNTESEWLISDFHFLRTDKNNIWFHKQGYYGQPSKKDFAYQFITNPIQCDLNSYRYKKCYALKLQK